MCLFNPTFSQAHIGFLLAVPYGYLVRRNRLVHRSNIDSLQCFLNEPTLLSHRKAHCNAHRVREAVPRCNQELRRIRKDNGLTQTELAARALVARRSLQNAEAGKEVTLETIVAVAQVLRVKTKCLIDEDPRDAIQEGPWTAYRFLQQLSQPKPESFCHGPADVTEAIRQMRYGWDRQMKEASNGDSRYDQGYNRVREIDWDSYLERYLLIWQRNRNSILFSTRAGVRTGVSVLLPISDEAYEKVLTGQHSFLDVTDDDIRPQSQNLLLDAAVEFPEFAPHSRYEVTGSLFFAILFQIASQSQDPIAKDFRILSFGASAANTARLEANGFTTMGSTMPEFNFPIYEFAASTTSTKTDIKEFAVRATATHYAGLISHFVRGSSIHVKRRFLCYAAWAYGQWLSGRNARSAA